MMEEWPGHQQVLTLSNPSLETIAGPGDSPALACLANDELHRICAARPDKFPAWVASLPLNNVEASLAEIDRTVATSNPRHPDLYQCRRPAAQRSRIFSDFRARHDPASSRNLDASGAQRAVCRLSRRTEIEIRNLAGSRLAVRDQCGDGTHRVFRHVRPAARAAPRHPSGGDDPPCFEGRVGPLWDQLGSRTSDENYTPILAAMAAKGRRPFDYFRLFYNDTAVGGAGSAIRCGLDFYGADRMLFATDCPFDPKGGPMFIRDTIAAIDGLALGEEDGRKSTSPMLWAC
jgi:uncharacterized protein